MQQRIVDEEDGAGGGSLHNDVLLSDPVVVVFLLAARNSSVVFPRSKFSPPSPHPISLVFTVLILLRGGAQSKHGRFIT
jgi:hypothetical protein